VICRRKEVFVPVLDANLGIDIERNHSSHLIEDFQKFAGGHVVVAGFVRHPELYDRFLPAIHLTATIDGVEQCGFQFGEMIAAEDGVPGKIDKDQLIVRRSAQRGDEFICFHLFSLIFFD
jgi:hypothetical protein